MEISLIAAKVICLASVLLLTLVFSTIPYFLVLRGSRSLVSSRFRERMVAILNCFAGGVFLSTLLLHIMTEGSEEFEEYTSEAQLGTDFPLFNTFVGGGFFLVALVEVLMHRCLHRDEPGHSQSHDMSTSSVGQYGAVGTYRKMADSELPCDNHAHHETSIDGESKSLIGTKSISESSSLMGRVRQNGQPIPQAEDEIEIRSEMNQLFEAPPGVLRAFLLLIALSFHTIFDGLAVGLQNDTSEVWQVFLAISIHKSIIAFCLGFELFKCYTADPCKAFLWLCFFSLMSPIGIGLGIYLTSGGISKMAKLLSSGILQGLAAGTFLYVTFLEILCVYIGHHCRGEFMHVFSAFIGFCFMSLVKLLDHE